MSRDDLYVCGSGTYLGLRDDVPKCCLGCKRITILKRRSIAFMTQPPCYRDKEAPNA